MRLKYASLNDDRMAWNSKNSKRVISKTVLVMWPNVWKMALMADFKLCEKIRLWNNANVQHFAPLACKNQTQDADVTGTLSGILLWLLSESLALVCDMRSYCFHYLVQIMRALEAIFGSHNAQKCFTVFNQIFLKTF